MTKSAALKIKDAGKEAEKDKRLKEDEAERQRVLSKVKIGLKGDYGHYLGDVSKALQADREIVLTAVSNIGYALEYAAEKLKADKQVVMTAVTHQGLALAYASEDLKADKQVVLAAVSSDGGYALKYAAENLKADRQVVLAALCCEEDLCERDRKAQEGSITGKQRVEWSRKERKAKLFNKASETLKADKQFVLQVVAQNGNALQYASADLRRDEDLKKVACRTHAHQPRTAWYSS